VAGARAQVVEPSGAVPSRLLLEWCRPHPAAGPAVLAASRGGPGSAHPAVGPAAAERGARERRYQYHHVGSLLYAQVHGRQAGAAALVRLHLLAAGRMLTLFVTRFVFQGNVRLHHRLPLARGAGCFACREPSHGPACERWVLRCEALEAPGAGGAGPAAYRAADFRTCGGDMCRPPRPPRPPRCPVPACLPSSWCSAAPLCSSRALIRSGFGRGSQVGALCLSPRSRRCRCRCRRRRACPHARVPARARYMLHLT